MKAPIILGAISRPKAMAVEWINYSQRLADKVMNGMLSGPVTQ